MPATCVRVRSLCSPPLPASLSPIAKVISSARDRHADEKGNYQCGIRSKKEQGREREKRRITAAPLDRLASPSPISMLLERWQRGSERRQLATIAPFAMIAGWSPDPPSHAWATGQVSFEDSVAKKELSNCYVCLSSVITSFGFG